MYCPTFQFVNTEDEAKKLCESLFRDSCSYQKKHFKPHYTPWTSQNGKEKKFVVWYHQKV